MLPLVCVTIFSGVIHKPKQGGTWAFSGLADRHAHRVSDGGGCVRPHALVFSWVAGSGAEWVGEQGCGLGQLRLSLKGEEV